MEKRFAKNMRRQCSSLSSRVLSDKYTRILSVASTCVVVSCSSSASQVHTPFAPVPGALNRSAEYTVMQGLDTLALELVTTCPERIIADNDSRKPAAHIHYETEFGPNGMPTEVSLEIWDNGASISGPPSQIARHFMVGDTAVTQVWRGNQQQIQKSKADPRSFPLISGYVGLFSQLLRVLRAQGPGATIPVFFVGSGGGTGLASAHQELPDSLIVRLDSTEFRTGWDRGDFTGGAVSSSGYRIVRTALQPPSIATARCNSPKLTPPKAVARVESSPTRTSSLSGL